MQDIQLVSLIQGVLLYGPWRLKIQHHLVGTTTGEISAIEHNPKKEKCVET